MIKQKIMSCLLISILLLVSFSAISAKSIEENKEPLTSATSEKKMDVNVLWRWRLEWRMATY